MWLVSAPKSCREGGRLWLDFPSSFWSDMEHGAPQEEKELPTGSPALQRALGAPTKCAAAFYNLVAPCHPLLQVCYSQFQESGLTIFFFFQTVLTDNLSVAI